MLNRKNRTQIAIAIIAVIFLVASGIMAVAIDRVSGSPIRVACVGDSITEGSKYPEKLQELLGSNYTVRNFGVSGSTVTTSSIRPYVDQEAFEKAKDFAPDIVVIMLGTNDANRDIAYNESSFEVDYHFLVNSFDSLDGHQLIWIAKPPPIYTVSSSYNNTYLVNTLFPKIDNIADRMNLPVVDIYNALENHSDYFFDGVHPNPDGAAVIASNLYDAITLPDGSPDYSAFA